MKLVRTGLAAFTPAIEPILVPLSRTVALVPAGELGSDDVLDEVEGRFEVSRVARRFAKVDGDGVVSSFDMAGEDEGMKICSGKAVILVKRDEGGWNEMVGEAAAYMLT